MPIIKANGIDMYYELHGTGQPLVLIAGYTGDHTFWKFMLSDLAKHFKVLIFDNRAIGQTRDSGSDFSLDDMAQDTLSLINVLGIEKPHILGQSMGGAIAQLIAKNHPQHINRLIILNSVAKFNVRTHKTLENLFKLRQANVSFDLFIDTALTWFLSSDYLANPELIKAFKDDLINNPFPQSIGDQERQFKALLPFDSRNWIKDIIAPTLVISAEEDIVALPEECKNLANGIPNAQLKLIPGGHSSPVEQVSRVNHLIQHFLTE